eukprot:2920209-Pleurochrysis_carterae.AAC.4
MAATIAARRAASAVDVKQTHVHSRRTYEPKRRRSFRGSWRTPTERRESGSCDGSSTSGAAAPVGISGADQLGSPRAKSPPSCKSASAKSGAGEKLKRKALEEGSGYVQPIRRGIRHTVAHVLQHAHPFGCEVPSPPPLEFDRAASLEHARGNRRVETLAAGESAPNTLDRGGGIGGLKLSLTNRQEEFDQQRAVACTLHFLLGEKAPGLLRCCFLSARFNLLADGLDGDAVALAHTREQLGHRRERRHHEAYQLRALVPNRYSLGILAYLAPRRRDTCPATPRPWRACAACAPDPCGAAPPRAHPSGHRFCCAGSAPGFACAVHVTLEKRQTLSRRSKTSPPPPPSPPACRQVTRVSSYVPR